ncbi:MAG TPA: metallophosphoesterase family protein [Usitatibacter sp.]|nr:metallophosphoesterase family protein [Usitatibacter sp.]
MLLAVMADIHANLEALSACLAHARAAGAERFAFLGDIVGYGADPDAVTDIVMEHARHGAVVVKGNHEEGLHGAPASRTSAATAAIDWTRERLTRRHTEFLHALPACVREGEACFVHASAESPERWYYVDSALVAERCALAAATSFTFAGHVHEQRLFVAGASDRMAPFTPPAGIDIPLRPDRACVVIVGSVGQPRDGNPAAGYVIADLEHRLLRFQRVPYDHFAAARKVRAAGLPESLAYRLERGM